MYINISYGKVKYKLKLEEFKEIMQISSTSFNKLGTEEFKICLKALLKDRSDVYVKEY